MLWKPRVAVISHKFEIDQLLKNQVGEVKFSWLKGHAGHPLNEAYGNLIV